MCESVQHAVNKSVAVLVWVRVALDRGGDGVGVVAGFLGHKTTPVEPGAGAQWAIDGRGEDAVGGVRGVGGTFAVNDVGVGVQVVNEHTQDGTFVDGDLNGDVDGDGGDGDSLHDDHAVSFH